jgi:hypothetical protein
MSFGSQKMQSRTRPQKLILSLNQIQPMEDSMMQWKYLSIKEIAEGGHYPFTIGQLRHYLTYRHKNGLQRAIRKIGKRIYLRQDLFEAWIESMATPGGQS